MALVAENAECDIAHLRKQLSQESRVTLSYILQCAPGFANLLTPSSILYFDEDTYNEEYIELSKD